MNAGLRQLFAALLAIFALALPQGAAAQDPVWVQIEARPSLTQAEDRARAWAARFDNVAGFRLSSGWYAIALGPYDRPVASSVLVALRRQGAIPRDSYVAETRDYGPQFWPVGAGLGAPRALAVPPPEAALPETPPGETVAEARAAERRLTREERQDIQRALEWEGTYRGAIDAAFGPGTRRAIEAWQLAQNAPPTGFLTTPQRAALLNGYREELGSLGLAPVADRDAGIEITLPAALVGFDRYEAPFAHYEGDDGHRVLLISQSGTEATLAALYEILQTLEIVPLNGPRDLGRRSFTLIGEDDEIVSHTYAELRNGEIKGFMLVWPAGDDRRRLRVLDEMRASFRPVTGTVLPDATRAIDAALRQELIAGLDIRQPIRSRSGFFVGDAGAVLTSAEAVAACARVTLGDSTVMTPVAQADGLALLRPGAALAPLGIAAFDAAAPAPEAEIAVSGYSYDGALGAPTLTYGRIAATGGLDGRAGINRLALAATPADAGGPVLDTGGAVRGMLLPRADGDRRLPRDVAFAADAAEIATFLSDNGVDVRASVAGQALDPVDLSRRAADMTVLVRCWD